MSANPCQNIASRTDALRCLEYVIARLRDLEVKVRLKRFEHARKILSAIPRDIPALYIRGLLGTDIVVPQNVQVESVPLPTFEDVIQPTQLYEAWSGEISVPGMDSALDFFRSLFGIVTTSLEVAPRDVECGGKACSCDAVSCNCDGTVITFMSAKPIYETVYFTYKRFLQAGVDLKVCSFVGTLENLLTVTATARGAIAVSGSCPALRIGNLEYSVDNGVWVLGENGARDVTWWYNEWYTLARNCKYFSDCVPLDNAMKAVCPAYAPRG